MGKTTEYVGISKESYGLPGETLEGFLEEVAFEPNLKERKNMSK